MATAQFALPFLQKDNEKSSSNYQISRNKFLKLLSKNGWGGVGGMLIVMFINTKFSLFKGKN